MTSFFRTGFSLLVLLLITACAASNQQEVATAYEGPLTPMPQTMPVIDPSDSLFLAAVDEYIKARKGPAYSRYEFTRVDLDDDGRREGIVMLNAPHSYWCGFNGCKMIVFKAHNRSFELVSEIAPVRGPLIVSGNTTNGWRDIIVHVSGRMDIETKDVALKFDGANYPGEPSVLPAMYADNRNGLRIFP